MNTEAIGGFIFRCPGDIRRIVWTPCADRPSVALKDAWSRLARARDSFWPASALPVSGEARILNGAGAPHKHAVAHCGDSRQSKHGALPTVAPTAAERTAVRPRRLQQRKE
jgi:hypothetical protein